MAKFARVVDGVVVEIIVAPLVLGGHTFTLRQMWEETFVGNLYYCPDSIIVGDPVNHLVDWIKPPPPDDEIPETWEVDRPADPAPETE